MNSIKIYKLVLTGGPCGGKTTGQSRLSTFFENLGWKVIRVPEAANVLLSGGIKFSDFNEEQAFQFQENLLKTMIHIENTYFDAAKTFKKNCLIICDRGAMDASAFIPEKQWAKLLVNNKWNNVDLRDTRYNHIIHLVSAANGAEEFYTTEEHECRSENVELARELDYKAASAWIGHPYIDVIDNSTDFEAKMNRLIECVCQKLGIYVGDRLKVNSRKLKFLIKGPLPPDSLFVPFQDFDVVHDYLLSSVPEMQVRLRKRGQNGNWSYIHTVRHPRHLGQIIEVKTQLTHRDYIHLLSQRDAFHFTIFKRRRCFIFDNIYYQLDIYKQPSHPRCKGLILMETYTSLTTNELQNHLPPFLNIEKEVTGLQEYSMFNLSKRSNYYTHSKSQTLSPNVVNVNGN